MPKASPCYPRHVPVWTMDSREHAGRERKQERERERERERKRERQILSESWIYCMLHARWLGVQKDIKLVDAMCVY